MVKDWWFGGPPEGWILIVVDSGVYWYGGVRDTRAPACFSWT